MQTTFLKALARIIGKNQNSKSLKLKLIAQTVYWQRIINKIKPSYYFNDKVANSY